MRSGSKERYILSFASSVCGVYKAGGWCATKPPGRGLSGLRCSVAEAVCCDGVDMCSSVILDANNHRYAIILTKGYITKNWFLVVC